MHWSPNTVTGQVKGAIPVTYWYIKDPLWSWHPLLNRNAVKCNRAYESLQDLIKFVSDSVDPVWIQRFYLCNKLTRCQSWWILGPHLCTEIQTFLRLCVCVEILDLRSPDGQERFEKNWQIVVVARSYHFQESRGHTHSQLVRRRGQK